MFGPLHEQQAAFGCLRLFLPSSTYYQRLCLIHGCQSKTNKLSGTFVCPGTHYDGWACRRMFTVILSWDMDVASDAIYCFCPNGLRSVHKPRRVFFVMCWVYIQIESQSPSSCHPVCVIAPRVLGCWCLTSVKEFYPWSLLQPQSSASWNMLCLVFGKCLPFQYTDFYSLFHTVRQ